MAKKLIVLATLAGALAIGALPAAAAPVLCVTTDVSVAGTALPTNGTTCLP
ncbi:MAG: hypothetical protein JWN31_1629 [Frankiales bacterium]|nr:hypothetical protein [Frankiales bacterium]